MLQKMMQRRIQSELSKPIVEETTDEDEEEHRMKKYSNGKPQKQLKIQTFYSEKDEEDVDSKKKNRRKHWQKQ